MRRWSWRSENGRRTITSDGTNCDEPATRPPLFGRTRGHSMANRWQAWLCPRRRNGSWLLRVVHLHRHAAAQKGHADMSRAFRVTLSIVVAADSAEAAARRFASRGLILTRIGADNTVKVESIEDIGTAESYHGGSLCLTKSTT